MISVVIPFRNDANTIGEAVSSATTQDYSHLEILLCDDGSTDRSQDLAFDAADGRPVRLVPFQPGGGAARARNAGIVAAKGKYVAFLDSDDVWYPTKLTRCVETLGRDGADAVCHAEVWQGAAGGREVRYGQLVDPTIPLGLSVYRINPFSTSALVVRTSCLVEAGLFDEELASAEDYDLWLKLALLSGFTASFIDDVLGRYTLREGSESARIADRHAALLAIGKRYGARIGAMSRFAALERMRYRSRVRLSTGVRLFGSGERVKGLGYAAVGLMQWPFRPELLRWRSARTSAARTARAQ